MSKKSSGRSHRKSTARSTVKRKRVHRRATIGVKVSPTVVRYVAPHIRHLAAEISEALLSGRATIECETYCQMMSIDKRRVTIEYHIPMPKERSIISILKDCKSQITDALSKAVSEEAIKFLTEDFDESDFKL